MSGESWTVQGKKIVSQVHRIYSSESVLETFLSFDFSLTVLSKLQTFGCLIARSKDNRGVEKDDRSTYNKEITKDFICQSFSSSNFFSYLQDSATMQFCANKLDKKDFFGKSDPFMVFYRSNEDGT